MNKSMIPSLKLNESSISEKFSNPSLPAIHEIAVFNKSSGIPISPPKTPPSAPRIPPRKPSSWYPAIAPLIPSTILSIKVRGAKITRPSVLNTVKIGVNAPFNAPNVLPIVWNTPVNLEIPALITSPILLNELPTPLKPSVNKEVSGLNMLPIL